VSPDPAHGNSGITGEKKVMRSNLHKAGDYITAVLQLK